MLLPPDDKPEIGVDLTWNEIEAEIFVVQHFQPSALVSRKGKKAKVTKKSASTPYGLLVVTCPSISLAPIDIEGHNNDFIELARSGVPVNAQEFRPVDPSDSFSDVPVLWALLPIVHRVDFLNLWFLSEFGFWGEESEGIEVLVSYQPYRGFLSPILRPIFPRLRLAIMSDALSGTRFSTRSPVKAIRRESARLLFAKPSVICGFCGHDVREAVTECASCSSPLIPVYR